MWRNTIPPMVCPICQEDELWLKRIGHTLEVKCYLCGWFSGVIVLADGQDVSDKISEVVKMAQGGTP